MKVIALEGAVNSGKTHTISVVYSLLLRDGFTQIPGHFRILGNPRFEDFIDILEKDGRKIGFASMGDFVKGKESLKSLLHELEQKGCCASICASRNNPKILSAVQAYPSHLIISKTPSVGRENDRIVNVTDALTMLANI